MKNLIVLLGLLISIVGYSQENKDNRWSFGLIHEYNTQIGGKLLTNINGTGYTTEFGQPNFTIGAQAVYGLGEKLKFITGLQYAKKSFTRDYFYISNFQKGPKDLVDLNYIEIPLGLRYYLGGQKVKFFTEGSMVNQLNLNINAYATRYVLGYKVGGGIEVPITDTFGMQLYANYGSNISNIMFDNNYKMQSIGVGIGFQMRL